MVKNRVISTQTHSFTDAIEINFQIPIHSEIIDVSISYNQLNIYISHDEYESITKDVSIILYQSFNTIYPLDGFKFFKCIRNIDFSLSTFSNGSNRIEFSLNDISTDYLVFIKNELHLSEKREESLNKLL